MAGGDVSDDPVGAAVVVVVAVAAVVVVDLDEREIVVVVELRCDWSRVVDVGFSVVSEASVPLHALKARATTANNIPERPSLPSGMANIVFRFEVLVLENLVQNIQVAVESMGEQEMVCDLHPPGTRHRKPEVGLACEQV